MKKIWTVLISVVLCVLLSIAVAADPADFVIENGVLVDYTGTATVITIPPEVESISAAAFADTQNLLRVTIESMTCTFDPGTFPAGVIIRAKAGSAAEAAAKRDGLNLDVATPAVTYTLTVNYVYADGRTAMPTYTQDLKDKEAYSIPSPVIEGFTCDVQTVAGTVAGANVNVTVTYTQTIPSGWKTEGGSFKYYDTNRYLVSETKTIDGVARTFDASGYLVLNNEMFTIDGKSYFMEGNRVATGYRIIGSSVYCFGNDGVMLANTTYDGYTFDINGVLTGDSILLSFSGYTYYLKNNTLYSGFAVINDAFYYFNSDFTMAKSTNLDGLSFGADGKIISGLKITECTVSALSDVGYTGVAHTPSVNITYMGMTLVEGVHYSLQYGENINPGTATVTVKGIAPFSEELPLTFNILGEDTYTLTVMYVNLVGMSMAPEYTTEVEPGGSYYIPSPEVEGYTPDLEVVEGTMGHEDLTVKVTYSKYKEDSTEDTSAVPDTGDDPATETSSESTSDPETEPDETTDVPETGKDENEFNGSEYNYGLFFIVFAIATIVFGGAIVAVINWDLIKKSIKKKKNAIAEKKAKNKK